MKGLKILALFDTGLQNMTFRVFALVMTYADKNGECFPSIAKMADKLGISRQAAGEIEADGMAV